MILTIRVKPGSKTDSLEVGDDILVKIRERAQDGKANEYLVGFLADVFDLPKSTIQIVNGHTSSTKRVSIPLDDDVVKMTLEIFRK
jgi:uncharacterized protein (TIGR00251 family)